MKSTINPDAYYSQLSSLVAAMPLFHQTSREDTAKWIGRVHALVSAAGNAFEAIAIQVATDSVLSSNLTAHNAGVQSLTAAVYRCLAAAELNASVPAQGAVIPVGHAHDAFVAFSRAIGEAKQDVLIIDRYMSEHVLEFARAAPEKITLRLLAGRAQHKPGLEPATEAWRQQFATERPIELRFVEDFLLHDRLVLVDRAAAWSITQSFNAIAARSPASILRFPTPEMAAQKVESYEALWSQIS